MNVVGYVRISRDEDKENYESIINQKNVITDYAALNNYSLQRIYEDDNVSGYTFDRPALNSLIRDMEEGKIDIVIAKDLSRIGRHNALTLLFIEQIRKLDKRLILINEGNGGYDTSKDSDDIIGIKTWYNELYVKDISRKIKSHLKIKQKEGKLLIREYFGYKKNTSNTGVTLVIDEDVAPIIRRIFKLYIEGNGYRKLAQILNEENHPTPSQVLRLNYEKEGKIYKGSVSKEWDATLVQRILKDDIYIGTLRLGKWYRKSIKGKIVKATEDMQYVFKNHHASIIDNNEFDLVQKIISKRKNINYRGNVKHENLFSGFLMCKDCGASLCALNTKREKGTYVCSTYHRFGKSKCSRNTVKESELIELFREAMRFIKEEYKSEITAIDKEIRNFYYGELNQSDSIDKLNKKLQQKKDELRVNLVQKNNDISKASDDFNKTLIEETYNDIINKITSEIKYQAQKIEEMKISINNYDKQKAQGLNSEELFGKLINKERPTRKDLELILDKVIISKDGNKTFQLLV